MSKIGNIVKVAHATNGKGRFIKAKPRYLKVVQEYVEGCVMVENNCEVWDIIPSPDPKAQWETFAVTQED